MNNTVLRSLPRSLPKPVRVLKQKKRKKLTSRMVLEKRADTLVREIVLDRDGYCVCPAPKKGHTNVLQCGHLITRGKESVKWSLWNCHTQCSGCNARHEHYSEIYTDWFIREFGSEKYHELVADSYLIRKLTLEELEGLILQLDGIHRRQLDNMSQNNVLKWRPYFTQKQILDGTWRKYEATTPVNMYAVSSPTGVYSATGH